MSSEQQAASSQQAVSLEPERHPMDELLREDRLPHIWCPGCGLGTALTCFIAALRKSGLDLDKVAVVSGIGCTGRVAGYLKLDSFHTTHGRAIPFATGLKLANPELKVVVFSGDGDLIAIGGNHFIHAARRNLDMTVICVNNFNYGMTGGQAGPTTPLEARTTTSPYGNFEHPFNLPYLAAASGAVYVARWTTLHVRRLEKAIGEALAKRGFSFVEVISPCPVGYGRRQEKGQREGLDTMRYYHDRSVIRHGVDPQEADITLGGEIIVGKFVDIEKPTLRDLLNQITVEGIGGERGVGGGEWRARGKGRGAKVGRAEIRLTGLGGQGIIRAGYILGKAAALYDGRHAVLTQSYGPEARGGASTAQVIISDEPIWHPRFIAPTVLIAMSQEGWKEHCGELREGSLAIIEEDLVKLGSNELSLTNGLAPYGEPFRFRGDGTSDPGETICHRFKGFALEGSSLRPRGAFGLEPSRAKPQPEGPKGISSDEEAREFVTLAKGVRLLSIPATRIAEELGRSIVANMVMLGFLAAVTDTVSVEALREAVRTSVPKGTEELNLQAFERGHDYGLKREGVFSEKGG